MPFCQRLIPGAIQKQPPSNDDAASGVPRSHVVCAYTLTLEGVLQPTGWMTTVVLAVVLFLLSTGVTVAMFVACIGEETRRKRQISTFHFVGG